MPSASLGVWRTTRLPCLVEIEAQCVTSFALAPPNLRLAEENLRGWVVLLSAHFQGFCRDLHTEAGQVIASKTRPSLRPVLQESLLSPRALDRGNPTYSCLKQDFDRLGLVLDLPAADPGNALRLGRLADLIRWRNVAAHQIDVPSGGLPSSGEVRDWAGACDGLAASLDRVVYDYLRRLLRRSPWPP